MTFTLATDEATINVANITGEDILSAFNYQFTKVSRTTDGKLARHNSGTIVGVLDNGQWITDDLTGHSLVNQSEATDVTFNEFKLMMSERFAKDSANNNFVGPNYNGVALNYTNGELVVTFPENFLKWDEIHGYVDNRYNITMHFNAQDFADMLAQKTGFEVTNEGANSSLKMQLQGQVSGSTLTPVNVVLVSIP